MTSIPTLIARARSGDTSVLGEIADALEASWGKRTTRQKLGYRFGLTPRQMEMAELVAAFIADQNMSPTMQEIADAMGVSKVTVFEHAGALERKGVLRRDKHRARSIRFVEGVL